MTRRKNYDVSRYIFISILYISAYLVLIHDCLFGVFVDVVVVVFVVVVVVDAYAVTGTSLTLTENGSDVRGVIYTF